MNKDENDDIAIEALLIKSLMEEGSREATQDQIDDFDAGISCLDARDKELLEKIDPLKTIKESRVNSNDSIIEFPCPSDNESWIQAAARQKDGVVFDEYTRSAIERRRKEILLRRKDDAGER